VSADALPPARLPLHTLAAQITARLGFHGIGPWLHQLAATMRLRTTDLMPEPAVSAQVVSLPHAGITLELSHPHATAVMRGDPDRWVIVRAVFDAAWRLPWPFDLDPREARFPQVMAHLMDGLRGETVGLRPLDLAAGDFRQSIFLDDGLVVGLTWQPAGQGFARMELVRLARAVAFAALPG
jgi:hypothetical protein